MPLRITLETAVADLSQLFRRGLLDPHGPNLSDDIQNTLMRHKLAECAWRFDIKTMALHSSCNREYRFPNFGFQFCPYCGLEIKVL